MTIPREKYCSFLLDVVTQLWLDNDMSNTATATKCHSCQVEASVLAGTASNADRNHWSLWGCTCTTEAAEEAAAWLDRVSR